MRIKKGDTVIVATGKERGKRGKVLTMYSDRGTITIEGVNLYRKHLKAKREGEKGEIVQVARPLQASNVLPYCSHCGKGVRVGSRMEGSKKIRYCRRCKTTI